MKKITEALKKLLPAEAIKEVEAAISEMVTEAKAEIEKEFNQKLTEAYDSVTEEVALAEATAEKGYQQAWEMIQDLQVRLEHQAEEYESKMEEGYGEAYEMLEAEKAKNNNIEVELYEEFNKKLAQMKDFMVEKIDQYLNMQNAEIYEHARRDLLNDPRMVEHKVALDKIIEIAASYVSEDDFSGASKSKMEETAKAVDDLKGQVRVLEARNVRLSTQNNKLNEQVREMNTVLTENTKVERKERTKVAGNVGGRGQRVLGEQVIAEYQSPNNSKVTENDQDIIENHEIFNDLLVLSGLKQQD